jgi:hypothetical protein
MLTPRAIPAKLILGPARDRYEQEADRIAIQVTRMSAPGTEHREALSTNVSQYKEAGTSLEVAPPIVHKVLSSPGQPLDAATRSHMEPRFGRDFSLVNVHSDREAARSARAVNALAYTVGQHIVLAQNSLQPGLLAHELAHVVQQSAAPMPWLQRQPSPDVPRKDFVFIMGQDTKDRRNRVSNPFFALATKYFRAHLPNATFVETERSLAGLLHWISSNVSRPIGNLYIVSHGNEDGTLSFSLDSTDRSGRMSVVQLREALHPRAGGPGNLDSVSSVVDVKTKIHIKGCDIGRTKEMVELIDEAFGGEGVVMAPTHEQGYTTDPALGQKARQATHDEKIGAFTSSLPALPAKPAPVDPKLKGDARKKAKREYEAALATYKTAQRTRHEEIRNEEKRIVPELDAIATNAGTVDTLSGPMFQRPGTRLFTVDEIRPEIDRLYGHLSAEQRQELAKKLVHEDGGRQRDQQGQKVDRIRPLSQTFDEPASLDEGLSLFKKQFRGFKPKSMTTKRTPRAGGTDLEFTFTDASNATRIVTESIPDEAALIAKGRENTNNPARYQWRVERMHRNGKTTLTVVGERVMAYLHHGSLDVGPHKHFSKPEDNPDFYATSTFTPTPPPPQIGVQGGMQGQVSPGKGKP